MATTKPPHNGTQAPEDLLEVEVFKGSPNTLIVKDDSLHYGFLRIPRQHLNQILLMFFLTVFTFLLFSFMQAMQHHSVPSRVNTELMGL